MSSCAHSHSTVTIGHSPANFNEEIIEKNIYSIWWVRVRSEICRNLACQQDHGGPQHVRVRQVQLLSGMRASTPCDEAWSIHVIYTPLLNPDEDESTSCFADAVQVVQAYYNNVYVHLLWWSMDTLDKCTTGLICLEEVMQTTSWRF